MQQAVARLIIEGAPLAPGILNVLTGDDQHKLHHIAHRLRALGVVIGRLINDNDTDGETADIFAHIANNVDDIAQLADALVRVEPKVAA